MSDSNTAPSQAPPAILVPRFVRALEAFATKKGFAISLNAAFVNGGYGRGEEYRLVGEWRGTRRQFLSLRFAVASFSFPTSTWTKCVIMNKDSPVRAGRVDLEGKVVIFTPDFGEVPSKIERLADVELIHYSTRMAYHGARAALIAAGIPTKRLAVSNVKLKQCGATVETFGHCDWDTRLQLDGSIVYRVDTERAEIERARRRAAFEVAQREYNLEIERRHRLNHEIQPAPAPAKAPRPSYLRLVVDNKAQE